MDQFAKTFISDDICNKIECLEAENKNNPDAIYTLYVHIVSKEISGKPHDKYYVGITKQKPEKRWGSKGCNYKNIYFSNAIIKYGWDNIGHIIITQELTHNEACNMEKLLIKHFNSNNKLYGYNISDGGDGGNQRPKYKVNQYDLQGNFICMYESASEAARILGFDRTHITRCCKHGGSSHGYMFSYEKETINKPFRRCNQQTVIQLTLDGKYIANYYSLNEAYLKSGINADNLLRCIKGRNKTAGGYKWKYLKDIDESEITDSFLLQKYRELKEKEVF